MLIGEASKQTGLSAKTIRFYSDQGLVHPRRDRFIGYRSFTKQIWYGYGFEEGQAFNFSIKIVPSYCLSMIERTVRVLT